MSDKIIRFDDALFGSEPDALVRVKVERTINAMPDAGADEIANAAGYERRTGRKAFRAGHHGRAPATKAGKLSLKAPELKGALFGSAVIERCRRRESSVEEALMEMCLAVDEGMREDAAGRERFFRSMIERGSRGVGPVVGDRCAGLVSTVSSMPPNAECQRCMVCFMRDVPSKTPPGHREWASAALKAVFAQENRESAMAKAGTVAGETEERKLKAAANRLRGGVGETAACLLPGFPANHGIKPRTNDMIGRLNREIRRRTRVVGGFPDSDSALMLVCAGIRYVTSRSWSDRRYMDMSRLDDNPGAAA